MSPFTRSLAVALFFTALRAVGANATVLLLHTNDLHNHIRSGAGDEGGLPWIAGYVAQARAERNDVVLLDAGDVTEKGDMVAARTDGVIMYEAMRRMRYDVVTVGNHELDPEYRRLRSYENALGQPLVSINLRTRDGQPAFAASRVLTVGAMKIGVIGVTVPQPTNSLTVEETGRAIAAEAARLRPEVHLLIALCHDGSRRCTEWSKLAPGIDVFVSGHTHERIEHPITVPATGARIVQTGTYARHVGRLDLVVDLDRRKIVSVRDELVSLPHASAPLDRELLAWVLEREKQICPEASQVVMPANPRLVGRAAVAWLSAEALRIATKADVAFCSAERIVRSPIYPGAVDLNAAYRATELAEATITTELTGREITAYLNALDGRDGIQTNWAGFQTRRGAKKTWQTNLEAEKSYRVAMAKLEWNSRFLREVHREKAAGVQNPQLGRAFAVNPGAVDMPGALAAYIKTVADAGDSLSERASALAKKSLVGVQLVEASSEE